MKARRLQQSTNSATTFFFSNFSDNYGEYDMVKVFQRWARVKEVFISRRLNRWGRRFGSVRLLDVENVSGLEREMDQAWIGKMKLYVNVPRYKRNELPRPEVRRHKLYAAPRKKGYDKYEPREGYRKEAGRPNKGKERREWREVCG